MTTPIQPVPDLVLASEFPSLADRPAGTYNQKAKAWADSENAMVTRARETALVTHNNALAAREAAEAAGPAAVTAVAARDKALEYRDSAAAIAASVGDEAGLPSLTGNAGNVLTVGPGADSVSWEPLPRAFSTGDVMMTAGSLPSPQWLPSDGSIYLKDSYPDLASQLGSLYPGRVWSKEQDYSQIKPNNTSFTSLLGVGVGGGRIVVSMNNTAPNPRVVFSDDGGLTWTSATNTSALTVLGKVLYLNGKFFIFNGSWLTVSDDGDIWGAPISLPGIRDITYGNGIYVVVGYSSGSGTIYSSTNATSWTSRVSGFGASPINSVAFGNGKFVAVGADGKIATSVDSTNWAQRTSGTSANIVCVSYGNGKFVALATGGVALTSVDGESWSLHSYLPSSITPQEMFFSAGIFYARFSQNLIMKSSDGISWTGAAPFPDYDLYSMAVDEDRLYFVAGWDSSYTLQALKKSSIGQVDIYGSASDGITQAMVGYAASSTSTLPFGVVVTRTKTTGWEARIIPSWVSIKINAIAFGSGTWVAVGDSGKIFTSSDTSSWQARTSGVTASLTAVTYGNGRFVAVGVIDSSATTILTSVDGVTWVRRSAPLARNLRGVAYGNSTFVAVGDHQTNPTLLVSSNGIDWRYVSNGVPTSIVFHCVGFFDGQFVVGGTSGTLLTSGDGIFWSTRITPFSGSILALAYGNGVCIAVGPVGTVLVSDDFINWSIRFASQVGTLNTASFFNDEFYAAGMTGALALGDTSYDKTTQFSVPALGNPAVRGYIKTGVQ